MSELKECYKLRIQIKLFASNDDMRVLCICVKVPHLRIWRKIYSFFSLSYDDLALLPQPYTLLVLLGTGSRSLNQILPLPLNPRATWVERVLPAEVRLHSTEHLVGSH